MGVKIIFRRKNNARVFRNAANAEQKIIARAISESARISSQSIKTLGDADILAAGNFTDRWTGSFKADALPANTDVLNPRIQVTSTIPYFMIHETGGVIHGKPLLWIPLSYTGLKMRAREYGRRYGLFRVNRKGGKAPLLLSIRDRKPKYFGIASVRLPKRFGIRKICRNVMGKFPALYASLIAKYQR